jgi:hypothetical protein
MSSVDFHPYFQFSEPNKEILLTEDRVIVKVSDSSYTGLGKVYLRLLPRPQIEIRIRLDNAPFTDFSNSVDSVLLGSRSLDISGFATQLTMSTDKGTTLTWTPKKEPIIAFGDDNTPINSVIFHVFNFRNIIGTRRSFETVGEAKYGIEHVDLTSEDWRVELRSLPSTNRTFGQLKEQGGFGLTHIGRFEKTDRSSFAGKEAQELLRALRFFLSFAKGIWCEPVCAVGFDNSGDHVCWELWSSPREPWHSPYSWFDPHHCEQLVDLFPGFMAKWNHEDWREALHEVIYWYLNANYSSRGIDAGIILTQAAIERLSHELAVRDRRLLSVNGFRDIRASDKFRLLFSTLGIPLDIPVETSELQRLASNSQMNWLDAPHALTEIRNSLVHPEHKHRGQFRNVYYEAWNLGLWYLEMSILAICGYSGTYGNRLKQRWVGQIEEVPWKK